MFSNNPSFIGFELSKLITLPAVAANLQRLPNPLYTYENAYLYVARFEKRDHFEYFENACFKNAYFHNILSNVQRWFIEYVLLH